MAVVDRENGESERQSASGAQEGVRPAVQAASHWRQRCREDVRSLQIRRRHVQHHLHLHYRYTINYNYTSMREIY